MLVPASVKGRLVYFPEPSKSARVTVVVERKNLWPARQMSATKIVPAIKTCYVLSGLDGPSAPQETSLPYEAR